MDGIRNYWRIWGYLLPIGGLLIIAFSSEEKKGRWIIGNLVVTTVIIISALRN